uniref:Uncharacterized protein n=1 Tax=Pyricularia oryzae (strain P131) TaxID=1143193 RepID=L7IXX3_PYRO1
MDREKEIKVVEELLGGLKAGAKRPGKHYPELAARMATFRYQQPKLSLSIAAFLTLSRPISLTQWGLISRYPSILDERAPDLNKSSTFRLCDWTVFLENLMQKNQKWTVLSELFYLVSGQWMATDVRRVEQVFGMGRSCSVQLNIPEERHGDAEINLRMAMVVYHPVNNIIFDENRGKPCVVRLVTDTLALIETGANEYFTNRLLAARPYTALKTPQGLQGEVYNLVDKEGFAYESNHNRHAGSTIGDAGA